MCHTHHSANSHKRLAEDPAEWYLYHTLYREARKDWPEVPYETFVRWLSARPHLVVGDFGCGEALLAASLPNTVHSFDHVAINDGVIACDMAHTPLEDGVLDVAIFSLSLMGTNVEDYLKEAHRVLKLDGRLRRHESPRARERPRWPQEIERRRGFVSRPILPVMSLSE